MEQYIVTKEEINRMLLNAYWDGIGARMLAELDGTAITIDHAKEQVEKMSNTVCLGLTSASQPE